jgi:hypothetical protein
VTGTFSGDVPAGSLTTPMPVAGSIDSMNVLRLQGSQPFVAGVGIDRVGHQAGIDLTWVSEVSSTTSKTGTLQLLIKFSTTNAYPDEWNIDNQIVTLTRSN